MKYTPMVEQYLKIKKEYQDMFLFYRLGDFYELFFDDALEASKLLEITLTGREAGVEEKIPMCGVPFHSASGYIETLINLGHKVAICEQVSEAGKGKLVERKVVQVITPGTYMNYKNYEENNYLGCLYYNKNYYLAYCDIMTGDSRCIELKTIEEVYEEIVKNDIKEVLNVDTNKLILSNIYTTNIIYNDDIIKEETNHIDNMNLRKSCDLLIDYIEKTQNKNVDSLKKFEVYIKNNYVYMTSYTLKNLEVTQNMVSNTKKGSLLSIIDKTKTASGSRKIKLWLENPLVNEIEIKKRQNIITDFISAYFNRISIQNILKELYDIERISSKLSYGIVFPRELVNLKKTLLKIPELKKELSLIDSESIKLLNGKISDISLLTSYLEESVHDEAGISVKDGNVIKLGFNKELDNYKNAQTNANKMLLDIEKRERETTGIKNLKIGYNKIFGYYIEISKGNLKNINIEELKYIRKQTLANCERFVSEELKEVENYILNANNSIEDLELKLFQEIKDEVKKYTKDLQILANSLSDLDVYISLATVAEEYRYIKPHFNNNNTVEIKEGRHPIVERMVTKNEYISNSCNFSSNENILLITGPNMSGKSTYMRQLALIVILAQLGSYVPCDYANLPIFDKIFTRIGASDDLAGGKSTFMVEMIEAKNALVESTKNSLLIFDEIGRGTSTYDGIALAQSIIEYINKNIKCKTLFSTHYHELTKLEQRLVGVKNIHVSAKEDNGELVFLYKVNQGAIEKSYGIHVAKLANLPDEIIVLANSILKELEKGKNIEKSNRISDKIENKNYSVMEFDFENSRDKLKELEEILLQVDILNTTPLQSLQILQEILEKIKK